MKLHRAYKFKMEPDFQQTEKLYQFAGCRRFVYNWALDRHKRFYKETEKTIPAKQLSTELTALKSEEETLFLKSVDSQSLQQALKIDFVHKITSDLVAQHDFIGIEDLNVKGISKNHRLAKSIHDAVLGELRRQLEYKSLWNHVRLIKISRWFPSSKMCGNCKAINQSLQLSDRNWLCQECGTFHNRDQNAAGNILREALNKTLNLAVGHTDNRNAHGRNVSLATASKSG